MKQLKKPTKAKNCPRAKRFDNVCKIIREALKIDHVRHSYIFEKKDDDDTACRYRVYDEGDYISIKVFPVFWDEPLDWQVRSLIHEHCHHICTPTTQAYNSIIEWVHAADVQGCKQLYSKADERIVCHWEAVIYDLIKDRLEKCAL